MDPPDADDFVMDPPDADEFFQSDRKFKYINKNVFFVSFDLLQNFNSKTMRNLTVKILHKSA